MFQAEVPKLFVYLLLLLVPELEFREINRNRLSKQAEENIVFKSESKTLHPLWIDPPDTFDISTIQSLENVYNDLLILISSIKCLSIRFIS